METWKIILIALVAIIYLLGTIALNFLDKCLPDEMRKSKSHPIVLVIMWIASPLLLVGFIRYKLRSTINK